MGCTLPEAQARPDVLAGERLQRLARARAVIADCMHVLVRATEEKAMLQDICRIVVARGGHLTAWAGYAEEDEAQNVRVIAAENVDGRVLAEARVSWAEARPEGRGVAGTVIRTRRAAVVADTLADPNFAPWRNFAERLGFRSVLGVPLSGGDSCRGVLVIYSATANVFDADEIALFEEFARDISFGIESLRARQGQARADLLLRRLAEGTASATGTEFMRSLVRNLAAAANVSCAFIAQLAGPGLERMATRAVWAGDDFADNFEFPLAGTPCAEVIGQQRVGQFGDVQRQFPGNRLLTELKINAYFGVPVFSSTGNALGVLALLDQEAIELPQDARSVLAVFAARAGGVLERLATEVALRESEKRFEDLATLASDWFWETDANECVSYISPRFFEASGLNPEDVLRRPQVLSGISGISDAARRAHVADTKARRPFRNFEYARRKADGRWLWIESAGKPIFDGKGTFTGYRGTSRDITERKQTESALAAKTEVLRDTLENMTQGITLVDRDLRLVAWNRRVLELLGFPESLVAEGATFADFIRYNATHGEYGPGDPEEQVRVRVERAERFEPHCVERVRPNGTVLEIRGAPLPGGGFVTTYTDITDRKRAELALRESEEQLRQLASNIPEAYWIEDVSTERLLYLSPAFVRITGWGIERGGVDAQHLKDIVAPEDHKLVLVAANAAPHGGFDEQYRIVRPDGTRRWVHTRTFPVKDAAGTVYRIAGVMEDITEHKAAEDRLAQIALYDALTNLPNRTLFYKSVQQTVMHAVSQGKIGAVLFLDLDRFKNVNDTLGHPVGDDLLREVATRLVRSIRARDTLGRLGGDEFGILLSNLESADDAATVAEKVLKAFAERVLLEGQEVFVTASIGIAVFPADGEDPDLLIRAADTAMYRAKGAGRNAYRFYTAEMNARALDRLKLEGLLRRAIERCEFLLHYQPKVHAGDSRLCGAEALLRWKHADRGLVSPAEFIPLLEETGLIVTVGEWVIGEVCRQIRAWQEAGLAPVRVAINLSGRQFLQGDLAGLVRRSTLAAGIDPGMLEFELTEGTLMSHAAETIGILEQLKQAGCALSVDDFGTGYSSLAYLKRFALDALKIDRSFISDAASNADDAAIVKAIIRMAHELDLKVVAEGVETQAQLEFLRKRGCDEIQGYLISKPLGADAFADYLRTANETEVSHATH